MSKNEHLDRVWDIIEKVGICMLTTRSRGGLRARPLEARPDREAGLIWFCLLYTSDAADECSV